MHENGYAWLSQNGYAWLSRILAQKLYKDNASPDWVVSYSCPERLAFAVLVNPANAASAESTLKDAEAAARAMRLQIQVLNARPSTRRLVKKGSVPTKSASGRSRTNVGRT
jgi:hypothetical protein